MQYVAAQIACELRLCRRVLARRMLTSRISGLGQIYLSTFKIRLESLVWCSPVIWTSRSGVLLILLFFLSSPLSIGT
jgi:hypothetical protein